MKADTDETRKNPKNAISSPPKNVREQLRNADENWEFLINKNVSPEKAEYVVKPPRIPVIRKWYHTSPKFSLPIERKPPMRNEPRRFIIAVGYRKLKV